MAQHNVIHWNAPHARNWHARTPSPNYPVESPAAPRTRDCGDTALLALVASATALLLARCTDWLPFLWTIAGLD